MGLDRRSGRSQAWDKHASCHTRALALSAGRLLFPNVNAGAIWEDAPVVVDRQSVTSRRPSDLPDFMAAVVAWLEAAGRPD